MNEETEVYTIYQRVTQIETRHVTAPKRLDVRPVERLG